MASWSAPISNDVSRPDKSRKDTEPDRRMETEKGLLCTVVILSAGKIILLAGLRFRGEISSDGKGHINKRQVLRGRVE